MSFKFTVIESFEAKVQDVRRRLRNMESAVVAFSGGVDSALLVFLAFQELRGKMIAAIGVSPSLPSHDHETALSFCQRRNIPCEEVQTEEFSDPNYVANPHNRCYYCKRSLFETLSQLAQERGYRFVIDGTNATDLKGHRPGHQAQKERDDIVSPLVAAAFTKDEVRHLAHDLGLDEVAKKPSSACLASRIQTHLPIDPLLLNRIDRAENELRKLGFQQVRVRHEGRDARVEIGAEQIDKAASCAEKIHKCLIAYGWEQITIREYGYGTKGT